MPAPSREAPIGESLFSPLRKIGLNLYHWNEDGAPCADPLCQKSPWCDGHSVSRAVASLSAARDALQAERDRLRAALLELVEVYKRRSVTAKDLQSASHDPFIAGQMYAQADLYLSLSNELAALLAAPEAPQ